MWLFLLDTKSYNFALMNEWWMSAFEKGEQVLSTHSCRSCFSKPASQPNPDSANLEDYKAAIGDLTQRPLRDIQRF